MSTYWAQIDINLGGRYNRLFMSDCGGKDQVVRAIRQNGWKGYEPPLPLIIAKLCRALNPVFLDVGANTGYYSLLAGCMDAKQVWAFEPVPYIREILKGNVQESGLNQRIEVSPLAVGESAGEFEMYLPDDAHGLIETSASLNPNFRQKHLGKVDVTVTTLDEYFGVENETGCKILEGCPVVMKIDVESLEPQVLKGGARFVSQHRPILALELLPGSDTEFFERFKADNQYEQFWLNPNKQLDKVEGAMELSLSRRDHLFVPREQLGLFAQAMTNN
jgi:FkbM family methyltransferase